MRHFRNHAISSPAPVWKPSHGPENCVFRRTINRWLCVSRELPLAANCVERGLGWGCRRPPQPFWGYLGANAVLTRLALARLGGLDKSAGATKTTNPATTTNARRCSVQLTSPLTSSQSCTIHLLLLSLLECTCLSLLLDVRFILCAQTLRPRSFCYHDDVHSILIYIPAQISSPGYTCPIIKALLLQISTFDQSRTTS